MVSILKRKGNRYFYYGKWHNIGNLKCRYIKSKDFWGETITIYWSESL